MAGLFSKGKNVLEIFTGWIARLCNPPAAITALASIELLKFVLFLDVIPALPVFAYSILAGTFRPRRARWQPVAT